MEILTTILQIIISIAVPVLVTTLTCFAKHYTNIMIQKIENEQFRKVLQEAQQIIFSSVDCVQQTYVEALKNKNAFDLGAQQIALAKAKEQAVSLMNKEMKQALIKQYGDVDLYMTTLIESSIADKHKNK